MTQTVLVRTDDQELEELPPIKKDEIAEEVFAARQYAKTLTRSVIRAQSILLVLLGIGIYGLATRTPRVVYVKISDVGRAVPIKYSGLEHYTPDAAVAKTYLQDWVMFRYERLQATALKTFPKNYLFLDKGYGQQVRERDTKDNVVANVLAGREPENSVTILATTLTSFGKQSVGGVPLAAGTAEIALRKTFNQNGASRSETWIVAVRFYLNPDQVEAQSSENPEYQTVNPLGLTIVEFIPNRTNSEAAGE